MEEDGRDDDAQAVADPRRESNSAIDGATVGSASWGSGGIEADIMRGNVIGNAPVGTMVHRIWTCPRLEARRCKFVPADLRHCLQHEPEPGNAALERALFPSLQHLITPLTKEATFVWVKRPVNGLIPMGCTIYTDGSMLDGQRACTARCGWSFVAIDDDGEVIVVAYGVPPMD